MVTLAKLMGVSRHLWEDFLRMQHDNLFPLVSDPSRLEFHRNREELQRSLESELAVCRGSEERIVRLNGFKDREIFRTDLRHITGRIDTSAFTREISNIAEVVVAQAATLCHERMEERFGSFQLEDGSPCRWSILAFGKCGGREMGFASDIELMFVYEGPGQTQGHERIGNQEYFVELVCLFLKIFKAPKEGIFEIDLRLRPYGKDGLLASTLGAFRQYYHPHGSARQFERMALTKLRPIAGDQALGRQLMAIRDDFVYADQSLDYENILHLRQRQARELVPSGTVNAKYSPGGLVDLEYYVQAHQIEQGRFHPGLRVTNMLEALDELKAQNLIDAGLARLIRDSYQLLRRLIDALRVVRGNAKDLSIPPTSSRAYTYLARRLGYGNNRHLQRDLYRAMALGRTLWHKKQHGQDWSFLIQHVLLACTDTHTRMLLPEIDVPQAQAWLHGGDFYLRKTESRRKRPVGGEGMKGFQSKKAALDRWCTQRDIPLYAVRGNHDVTDPWGFFQRFHDISGQIKEITTQLWVAGLGWSGERFYQLPQEADVKTICEHLTEQLSDRLPSASRLIVLSHYPADTELCPGFVCINHFLARWKPIVFIQGHIHEAFKQQTFLSWEDGTQTLVFNPGPDGGILTIQPEAGTASFASQ